MAYRVAFNVSTNKLADVIGWLDTIPHSQLAIKVAASQGNTQPAVAQPRKAKRTAKKRVPRATTQQEKILQLLATRGLPPFKSSELARQAKALGIPSPRVFNVLRREVSSGNLRKLEPGVYQKTGQTHSEAMAG